MTPDIFCMYRFTNVHHSFTSQDFSKIIACKKCVKQNIFNSPLAISKCQHGIKVYFWNIISRYFYLSNIMFISKVLPQIWLTSFVAWSVCNKLSTKEYDKFRDIPFFQKLSADLPQIRFTTSQIIPYSFLKYEDIHVGGCEVHEVL